MKIKLCKYCNEKLNTKRTYCSNWCKEMFSIKKYKKYKLKKKKIKKIKQRFCKCGNLLKKYQHFCVNCKNLKKEKEVKYFINGKCLFCGDDVVTLRKDKKLCSRECSNRYYRKLSTG